MMDICHFYTSLHMSIFNDVFFKILFSRKGNAPLVRYNHKTHAKKQTHGQCTHDKLNMTKDTCFVVSCVLPCRVLSCLGVFCYALSSLICLVLSSLVLSCLVFLGTLNAVHSKAGPTLSLPQTTTNKARMLSCLVLCCHLFNVHF